MGRKAACGGCGECARCKRAAYMREWYARGDNAEKQRASQKASRLRRIDAARAYDRARGFRIYDPVKVSARRDVRLAIAAGRLKRQPCEKCGNPKSHAHHWDYSRTLDVTWLCAAHHGEVHRKYPTDIAAAA